MKLTARQREVVEAIASLTADRGAPPTYRELMAVLGIRSSNGITGHLKSLAKKGILAHGGATRSIRLLTLTAAQAELCERVADKVIADYTGLTIGPPNPASTDQLQMRIARALRSALYGERELQEEPQ